MLSSTMDDVLITGQTKEEHDDRLQQVLQIVQNAGLKLNREKCKIAQTRVDFLGMKLDKDGVHPDPAKVAAIIQMAPPTTKEEVKRLMGMVNWLARFLPNASSVAAPINDLLKSNVTLDMGTITAVSIPQHQNTLDVGTNPCFLRSNTTHYGQRRCEQLWNRRLHPPTTRRAVETCCLLLQKSDQCRTAVRTNREGTISYCVVV